VRGRVRPPPLPTFFAASFSSSCARVTAALQPAHPLHEAIHISSICCSHDLEPSPRTQRRPTTRWCAGTSTATLGPDQVISWAMCHVSTPSPPHMFPTLPRLLTAQSRQRDSQHTRDYVRDHNCPGHTFCPISFETLGLYTPGAMQFIRDVAHGAFPGAEAGRVRCCCVANIFCHDSVPLLIDHQDASRRCRASYCPHGFLLDMRCHCSRSRALRVKESCLVGSRLFESAFCGCFTQNIGLCCHTRN
jgi:hypothetical protein